ncbi:MAG TPA: hypothetical protein PLU17_12950, partial [Chitinophagaceae bacterium]|nr:hypothetical protein [Chitinophagaceae bacterium]
MKQINKIHHTIPIRRLGIMLGILFTLGIFNFSQAQVGTPSYMNHPGTGATANAFPLNSATSNKVQWIYAPGAFTTLGSGGGAPLPGGQLLTKIYIKFASANATSSYNDLTVSLGQNVGSIPNYTQAPATTGVPFNTGLTTCFYQASGFVFTGNVAGAWYGITLQTPFLYDPSLALICEVKCSNTAANGNGVGHITTAGISQRLYAGFAATTGTANTLLAPIGFDVISAAPCTAPPTAGTAISSSSNVCSGTNVSLGLVGNSNGSGQTYQWESSSTSGGPFTPIGVSSSAPSLIVNPTSTQYYRCQVTCSSVTTSSTEVLVNVPALFPGGFYTIDNTLSTGGGNFASFNEAVSAISCGISGPVTFDVASGTGPYTEQVVIPQIFGASSTNTITFLGNNQVLTYNATLSTAPSTLNLNGADFIRFNDLQIVGTGPTYALVTHLWNNANNNIFTNCTFTAPANGTATTQAPFSISGTEVSATATGQSGSNNVLDNCSMNNGYYGITMVGNSTTPNTGNQILNSSIRDFYFYGSYNQYNNGTIISNNLIERPTRTTFTTSCYGIYLTTACSNFLVEKNKIRNTWVSNPSSTGTQYSIACVVSATLGNENKIYNNLVSDIQFSGTIYGLYFTTTNYLKAYHNTISLDHTTATGTTTTYGIYSSSTSAVGIDFQNNNISITRGGGGIKYGIQISSATGVTCNYNNIYVNASLGTNYTGFYIAGFTTLAAWQAANGGVWDQQSASFDPLFTDPLTYDYSPGSASINNMCNNLGVLTDINGISRGVSTDPGCYEFSVAATDMGVSAFVSPNASGCYSATEDIVVTIKNYGSAAIDFSTTSASVVCDISGAITSTLTVNPTGILLPGATMNITLTPSINMTVNGTYVFNPYTVLSGDLNNSNDALSSPITRTVAPIGGTVTSSLPQICVSGTPTLTVSGYSGGVIQWQESTVSSTGPWVNVGTGASIYTPSSAITQTTYYQVEIACNGNLGYSNVLTNVVNNPTVISTIPGARCGIGPVNLEATVDVGANAKWYTTPTGGVPLYTGSPFTTPTIAATTTYYVESVVGIGGLDSLGQPISTSGTTPNYHNMFKISSPTGLTLNSIGIKCNNTLGTLTAWDIYYRPNDYLLTPGSNTSAAGWTLLSSVTGVPSAGTTEFTYVMFGQNLVIPPGAVYSFYLAPITGSTHQYGTVAQNGTIISNANATIIAGNRGASLFNCPTAGGHPIIKIKYSLGCVGGTRVPVVATVNPAPSILASAADPILCPGGTTSISVSSSNDPDYTYSWTSSIGGFTATGPGPHSISPLATTTYTVTAVDNTAGPNAGCAEIGTVTVVTAPTVLAGTVTSSVGTICVSGSPELTVTGSAGGAIQWQESVVSASGPFTNVGTGSSTYLPGIITQTTYYRVEVSCGSTAVQSNVITVTINNPQILSTTPGSRCGYG